MLSHTSYLLNAFLLVVVLVIGLDRVARAVGLTDKPTARKVHEGLVPLTGGIAMYLGVVLSIAIAGWPPAVPANLVAGLTLLLFLGVADDMWDVRATHKFAGQFVAVLVMIIPGDHVVRVLPGLIAGEDLHLELLAVPFTCVFMLGLINAYNMIDGLDGLAGGISAAAFFWLATVAAGNGRGDELVLLVFLFAALGFLVFNMRHPWRARSTVFMGDAGSMMLGAVVAYYTVVVSAGAVARGDGTPFVSLLWLSAVPAIDTISLIVRRLMAGQSPFSPDRRHIHHVVLDMDVSHRATTAVLVAGSFLCGGIGYAGVRLGVPASAMIAGLAVLAVAHAVLVVRHDRRIAGARHAVPAPVTLDPAKSASQLEKVP